MKIVYCLLLLPFMLFAQEYSFKNDIVMVNLTLNQEVKDSLVAGIINIKNISNSDILILKNDINSSNAVSPKVLLMDISTRITDSSLIKNYPLLFYYLKPDEIIIVEKKHSFDWKQLLNVNILFNVVEISKLDCGKCNRLLKKSIKNRTNQISSECLINYQKKNGLGEVFVKFSINSNLTDSHR